MAALPNRTTQTSTCIGTLTINNNYIYNTKNNKTFPQKTVYILYNNIHEDGRHTQEIVLRDIKDGETILKLGKLDVSNDIGRFEIIRKEDSIYTLGIYIYNDKYTKLKISPIMIWILLDYAKNVKNSNFYIDDDQSDGFWDSIGMIENPNVENEDSLYAGYEKFISYKLLHKYADQQKKNYYESVENNTNKFIIDLTDKHSIAYRVTNSRSRSRNRSRSSDRSRRSDRSRSPYKGGKHKTKKRSQH